ncbi:MAG: PQQ-binding-like beta-propeller repeat protein [Acidobacteriia bacterium]|nr:PQQ-binding-like beta-propeller repeat protein [Terriglobia bacterium]
MRTTHTVFTLVLLAASAFPADWTDYRGPRRDGSSPEKNLPVKWAAPSDLAWTAPYGGRSTPIIMNGRFYLLNAGGAGSTLQERVVCLDADTGKLIWEYRFNLYHSDVPPHRIAWSSPAGDPETGNVYVFGAGGTLLALSRDGKKVWERSLTEDIGLVTTHGGRTASPVIEGNLVIVSGVTTTWGEHARAAHRFIAFDKRTGQTQWFSAPGGRPFDTTYSPPVVVTINGVKILIAGGGDGTVHAIKVSTGESVWKYVISKRGVNTGVVVYNNTAYVSHSEENFDTNEMGLLAAVDATAKGDITAAQIKWKLVGFQGGYSSPVMDGDRLYQIDNGSNVFAFDAATGRQIWKHNLGTIQKSSPVLADGKIYVGNENGRFFILKPTNTGCDRLSEVQLGSVTEPEQIIASAAVANGRVYVVSQKAVYAFGKKNAAPSPKAAAAAPVTPGKPVFLQVAPTELILKPGESAALQARLFDEKGNFVRTAAATWALEGLRGTIGADGRFTAESANSGQAGTIKATVDGITGAARARILPNVPFSESFDSTGPGPAPKHWVNATGKFQVRELMGNQALIKLADNAFTKRARTFFGHIEEHDYTIQADLRATEKRRQMGDAGVVAQRYQLALYGNHQRIELQPWQPETERTVVKPFPWKPDTWYRLKLRVENLPDGKVKAQGKAWPAAAPEPAEWTIERVDPIGNRQGAPGIYADAPSEISFDSIKVTKN